MRDAAAAVMGTAVARAADQSVRSARCGRATSRLGSSLSLSLGQATRWAAASSSSVAWTHPSSAYLEKARPSTGRPTRLSHGEAAMSLPPGSRM